jgi:integrase
MTTEYLLDKEMQHVLAALTPSNRLAMEVSLHTGLRIGDVLALRAESLDRFMWVTEKKTGKKRRVGLPDTLYARLISQAVRAGSGWCFPHRLDSRRHRTRQSVWADVKRAARAFRLPQNVAPHSARKVYAVDLMAKYGNIAKVKKVLNHKYDSTTMLYAMADRLLEARLTRKMQRSARRLSSLPASPVETGVCSRG